MALGTTGMKQTYLLKKRKYSKILLGAFTGSRKGAKGRSRQSRGQPTPSNPRTAAAVKAADSRSGQSRGQPQPPKPRTAAAAKAADSRSRQSWQQPAKVSQQILCILQRVRETSPWPLH